MAPANSLAAVTNHLLTPSQLLSWKDREDDSLSATADAVRYAQIELTQSAGVLLRLPQEVIAQAIVLFQRFNVLSAGTDLSSVTEKDASAATLYLTAKLSFTPVSPRSLLSVYHYLQSKSSPLALLNSRPPAKESHIDPISHHLSEGIYEALRNKLYATEAVVLKVLAFDTHVVLPHPLALTYLSVLGLHANTEVTIRTLAHLTTALLSPQLLYLTHQPNALAVAAIYLAARESEVKLVDGNWWEVFDVDREDLGFLVVSMQGVTHFVQELIEQWRGQMVHLD